MLLQCLQETSRMHTKDITEILQDLIRLDSQNPPGNEKLIVDYIQAYCEEISAAYQVYTYEENRSNIIIRMGRQTDENLIILGHLDVVCAHAAHWSHDPFGGEIADGSIHGRGALDMKYFIAAVLSVLRTLKPMEETLDRGITCIFTADEENGSSFGIQRLLCEEGIAQELQGKTVINEGGASPSPMTGPAPIFSRPGRNRSAG